MAPSPSLERLRGELASFMDGGEFGPLWRAVMDVVSQEELPESDEAWFDELYELVYMASPDPVTEIDTRNGVIGANQLRTLIQDRGLSTWVGPS